VYENVSDLAMQIFFRLAKMDDRRLVFGRLKLFPSFST
jgi:hypothetical protein